MDAAASAKLQTAARFDISEILLGFWRRAATDTHNGATPPGANPLVVCSCPSGSFA
jgi:hypothetical protein